MLVDHPILKAGIEFYDMSREEIMERGMKVLNYIAKDPEMIKLHQSKSLHTLWLEYNQGQVSY